MAYLPPRIFHHTVLAHGEVAGKKQVLFRAANLEVYMFKDNITGELSPITSRFHAPCATDLRLPEGLSNNFAYWTPEDVVRWADAIIPGRDRRAIDAIRAHRITGLQMFVRAMGGAAGRLSFVKRTPERTETVLIVAAVPPPEAPPFPEEFNTLLNGHIVAAYNLLCGHLAPFIL